MRLDTPIGSFKNRRLAALTRALALVLVLAYCPSVTLAAPLKNEREQESSCGPTYLKFYQRGDVEFRFVFGYKDARPARLVTDRYDRLIFIARLVQLGFRRAPADEELLNLEIMGLDHKPKQVHLRVVESSVGPDDEANKANPFQIWQSLHARKSFVEGLKMANAVFYIGHSRTGGGPDFEPPRCGRDGHVDYGWYQKTHPGLSQMKLALARAQHGTRLIGLLSCDSDRHFTQVIQNADPRLGLLGNKSVLYYMDSIEDAVSIVKNLIQFKCPPGFSPPGTELTGFFKNRRRAPPEKPKNEIHR